MVIRDETEVWIPLQWPGLICCLNFLLVPKKKYSDYLISSPRCEARGKEECVVLKATMSASKMESDTLLHQYSFISNGNNHWHSSPHSPPSSTSKPEILWPYCHHHTSLIFHSSACLSLLRNPCDSIGPIQIIQDNFPVLRWID